MNTAPPNPRVAAIVPAFPRFPDFRPYLTSLRTQTRPPDLVVLLDDRTNPDVKKLPEGFSEFQVEVIKVETSNFPKAINAAIEQLEHVDYVSFLQAGDFYAPQRLEKCLGVLSTWEGLRPPAVIVTGLEIVGSRGQALPSEDTRARYFEKLWAAGRTGVSMANWLGTGNFVGPASNIFARRSFLAANPLPEAPAAFSYGLAILSGLQGLLAVVDEPLLFHYPVIPEGDPATKSLVEALRVQLSVMTQLEEKLATSHETRRNFAAFSRVTWNNLSGLRGDLFQQAVLRLASTMEPDQVQEVAGEVLRSQEVLRSPLSLRSFVEANDPLDTTAYADALWKTREKLKQMTAENKRLNAIAEAAQDSGWIRLGAWLGERSSRRIMEMDEADRKNTDGQKSSVT